MMAVLVSAVESLCIVDWLWHAVVVVRELSWNGVIGI